MDVPTLFASNLRTFSNNAITDLQYAGLTRDEPLSWEALQVAAGFFEMWDQCPKKLQDEEWMEEAAVMEAGQDLWTMWSLKDSGKRKAREILGGVNMDSGPLSARPSKVSKTRSGQPSTKQTKAMVDILAAHVTDKDLVDEGLEGDIAVRVQWSMRAVVRLAPHGKRVEFQEVEGPCQQCTTAKVADHCWYLQVQLPCCHCLNSGIACKNLARETARDAQRWARVVRKRTKRAAAPMTWVARTSDDDEEGPAVGPSNTTLVLPTLGAEDNEGEVLGVEVLAGGISGGPKLEERDDGVPVTLEVAKGDGELESTKLVWQPADEPATEFAQVTRCVGELRELEASMADYTTTCKQEYAALRFKLLRMQTVLGKMRKLQGMLVEARQEAEEALWEILAFK
ncbi:hypothetical protein C0991_001430 [Blastosporella zonata]|nr:hypothetical protein C0991_001430 [Blastosporella zonata]